MSSRSILVIELINATCIKHWSLLETKPLLLVLKANSGRAQECGPTEYRAPINFPSLLAVSQGVCLTRRHALRGGRQIRTKAEHKLQSEEVTVSTGPCDTRALRMDGFFKS